MATRRTTRGVFISRRILATGLLLAGLTAHGEAQTPLHEFVGDPGDHMGHTVAGVGDVNGDSYDDVAVSSQYGNTVRIFSGKRGDLLVEIPEPNVNGDFGVAMTGISDLDRDGLPDLVIGEPASGAAASTAGSVHAYSGTGRWIWTLDCPRVDHRLGTSVDRCGDLDGDGFEDVLVGAVEMLVGPGYALVLSGRDGTTLMRLDGVKDFSFFGQSVAGVGDVSGDRIPDLLIGAPQEDGKGVARLFSGADGRRIREHLGDQGGDQMGHAVRAVGDMDGDHVPDYLVGAPWQTLDAAIPNAGIVYVFSGRDGRRMHRLGGLHTGELYGHSAAGAGDVNRDGILDFVVGAREADSSIADHPGRIEIRSGTGELLYTWVMDEDDANLGQSVAAAGDVNNDGCADVVVGAPWSATGGAGTVSVLGGARAGLDLRPGGGIGGDRIGLALWGDPLQPFALFITQVKGRPVNLLLLAAGFDKAGRFQIYDHVPRGLGAADLVLEAFSLTKTGDVARSNEELFLLR